MTSLQDSHFWLVSTSFLLPAMQKGCKQQYPQQHWLHLQGVIANFLRLIVLNDAATMLHLWCSLPHCSLLAMMHSLAKLPRFSLLAMAKISRSDTNLNCMIKADNGHGLVDYSAWVPLYSTQLLISKLGIMIVLLSINLGTSCWIPSCYNQSERLGFGCVLSPPWHHDALYYCM